ncbi:MAG: hypothetical protein ACTSYN_03830, partial [Candidatus Heimdallarchaeaceae archaeon]
MPQQLFVPYLAFFTLDKMGMDLRSYIPFPFMSKEEIVAIGNYYSVVLQAISKQSDFDIYGPLPLPHHENYHLLLVSFKKANTMVKDKRATDAQGMGIGMLLIIYDALCDQKVKYGHTNIRLVLKDFLDEINDLSEINDHRLKELSKDLMESVLLDEQIRAKTIDDVVRDIASRFNTIQTLCRLLSKRTKIGVISSDSFAYNIMIQALFHYQNIDFIYELTRNECVTRIDTYYMRVILTLLFDLETIAGLNYLRDIDYYLYIASLASGKNVNKHISNVKKLIVKNSRAKL